MENKHTCHMTSEQRLIDVDDEIQRIQSVLDEHQNEKDSIAYYVFYTLIECLKKAPTVDAVEVVRCKKCKHCKLCYPEKQIGQEPTPGWYCKVHKSYRRENDFCSYGERREGE